MSFCANRWMRFFLFLFSVPEVLKFTWQFISQPTFFSSINVSWYICNFSPFTRTEQLFIMKQSNPMKSITLIMFKESQVLLKHTIIWKGCSIARWGSFSNCCSNRNRSWVNRRSWWSPWNQSATNLHVVNKTIYYKVETKLWSSSQEKLNSLKNVLKQNKI